MSEFREFRPREQVRAAVAVSGLVLLSLAIWVLVIITSDSPTGDLEAPTDATEAPATDPSEDDGADAPDTDAADQPATDDDASRDDASRDDPSDDPETTDPEAGDHGPTTIDFDGECTVEIDEDEPPARARPWQFPECDRAPISLEGAATRWVVVVQSLSGDDFTEAEALERVDTIGDGQQLLWSSHYPSLNPDLWVVIEGPFDDEEAAAARADEVGGGVYPRELSDDEDDRYCVAADGCVGRTQG